MAKASNQLLLALRALGVPLKCTRVYTSVLKDGRCRVKLFHSRSLVASPEEVGRLVLLGFTQITQNLDPSASTRSLSATIWAVPPAELKLPAAPAKAPKVKPAPARVNPNWTIEMSRKQAELIRRALSLAAAADQTTFTNEEFEEIINMHGMLEPSTMIKDGINGFCW